MDVKQIGRELGVRYILEGSVRKAGSKVRITGQLIDTSTGAHLWADRFDGALEDIFDLQDQVTASVVGAIAPKLEQAEIERAKRKPTENLDAYDYYLRWLGGSSSVDQGGQRGRTVAIFIVPSNSIPISPRPTGWRRGSYSQRKASGWVTDRQREITETARLARQAAELGRDDAVALSTAGIRPSVCCWRPMKAKLLIGRALALNPNLAWAWLFSGWVRVWLGEPEAAIERRVSCPAFEPERSS